jgi:hypothetical protein
MLAALGLILVLATTSLYQNTKSRNRRCVVDIQDATMLVPLERISPVAGVG